MHAAKPHPNYGRKTPLLLVQYVNEYVFRV